jgi:transcriptional regulator with XRE-family HTH domain
MEHHAFRTFLKSEMERRNVSIREFASLVKVSHTTIQRFVDDKSTKRYVPTLDFLDKLAAATGVSLNTLLAICFPETARTIDVDPDVAMICDLVSHLSLSTRQTVIRFIRSFEE